MTKAIGIDIGGEIKFSSGEFQLSIPNVIGSSDPAGWGDLASDKSWPNNLILVEDDEEFYIGELARTQSQIKRFILDQGTLTKIDDIFLLIKAVLPLILKENEEDIALGIGLPISTPVEKMKELSSRLKGQFNVNVQNEATKETLEMVLNIKKVFIMPEAYGAYYNVVSDTEDETVIDAVVISLDLLTELLVIYNGNLIRNASRNLTNASLFILANKIAGALQQQVGAIVNPHSILKNIREDQKHVIISGKTYDIGKIKEHYIRQISSEIVENLLEILKFLPMEATMEYYILSGEALDLFWTEIQMLILENELIEDFDVDKIIIVKNPAFANAIGFEKMVNKNIEKSSQKHDE
ncbi:MAG: ParM/StbA family protein [Promethearchaeota archaeon]|nr:MAG: ParM/StbA family protein [Candidatus Lokiarchaeota archaeon]